MKGWKTILLAVAVVAIGALEALDWTNIITGDNAPFIISGLGIIFAYLRKITNTPVGKSHVPGGGVKTKP